VRQQAKPWLIERGLRLYDTRTRTYVITEDVTGELVREVPFEELPAVLNDLIAAEAVLKFQSNFDADNNKRQELTQAWSLCRIAANSENIRQLSVNLINSNTRLSRIKAVTRRLRY
jgi:polyhydroxyalkanoate synthesis regulator protein